MAAVTICSEILEPKKIKFSGNESTCLCRRHRFNPRSRRSHMPESNHTHEPLLSQCSRARELQALSHMPWSPCSTREASAMRSLHTTTKGSPHSPQLGGEKAHQSIVVRLEHEDVQNYLTHPVLNIGLSIQQVIHKYLQPSQFTHISK